MRRAPLLATREEATSVEVQAIGDLPLDMCSEVKVAKATATHVCPEGELLRRYSAGDIDDATGSCIAIEDRRRAFEHLDTLDIIEVAQRVRVDRRAFVSDAVDHIDRIVEATDRDLTEGSKAGLHLHGRHEAHRISDLSDRTLCKDRGT